MAGNQSDEPLIFPIGHYTGAFHPRVGSSEHHHNVMLGAQVLRLDDEQLAVWLIARGLPGQVGTVPWTRHRVAQAASDAGVADVPQTLAGLTADGLLAETIVGSEHSVDFAESYRLIPLLLGLGNTSQEPALHRIGLFAEPLVTVTGDVYSLWEWAHLDNNLWAACGSHAATSLRAGLSDPHETVPERILTGLLGTIHPLLAAGAGYLDLALVDQPEELTA